MFQAQKTDIIVRSLSHRSPQGWLQIGTLRFHCALGQNGRGVFKCEGDGLTPIGRWPILSVYFRANKRPPLKIPSMHKLYASRSIRRGDGWCDQPGDANYNRFVTHPYGASAENLWRNDNLYDVVVVLGHNHRPRVQGGGSAIFMHIAAQDNDGELKPSAGCITLRPLDLQIVLSYSRRSTHICIPS